MTTDIERLAAPDGIDREQSDFRELGLVTVVVPVYNEEEAVAGDLQTIKRAMDAAGLLYEIIVVDDGSKDRSAEIVRSFGGIRLIQHPRNMGVGAARKTGIRYARGQVIITTDGDGTYPNQDMPRLLAEMGDNDMVVGARIREAGTKRWLRTPAKTFIRLLASYMTGVHIPDLNSGLRCFRKRDAERFLSMLPQGHSWESTITMAFLSSGYLVKFVPIEYYERKGGVSSFHPVGDTLNYLSLLTRTVMYFNPLKILAPLSFFLLAIGGLKLLRDVAVYNFHVPGSTIMLVITGVQVGILGLIADLIVRRVGRWP